MAGILKREKSRDIDLNTRRKKPCDGIDSGLNDTATGQGTVTTTENQKR